MQVKPTNNALLIYNFVTKVFPMVKQELNRWRAVAAGSPSAPLAEQALASISLKSFHCLGGSIYALYPGVDTQDVVEFIVAYQTISDYLDNLVDSLGVYDEQAFAQLHLAMTEALNPEFPTSDYYLYYPFNKDGGYLQTLVESCRNKVSKLPGLSAVKDHMLWLATEYSRLQTLKHLDPASREQKMLSWLEPYGKDYPQVSPWEFAAATGSTLGIFCLYAAASSSLNKEQASLIRQAYFPWICGLHILLDYFIDLQEDLETNQLNFVEYYSEPTERHHRLQVFVQESLEQAKTLPYPSFHKAVVQGLLAMYLSDPKSSQAELALTAKSLLAYGGNAVQVLHWVCRQLRERKII